jgi:multidrug efflux pump subunit AcrA (membrane-fusion protein)
MDAFPDTSFEARVTDVATLARNRSRDSKVKVFDVTAEIEAEDDRLMPGMTVSCEIVVERVPDVLYVPLDAVFRRDDKTIAYVRNGRGFDVREVSLGSEGNDNAIVEEGLSEGDQVALMDPTLLGTETVEAPEASGSDTP